ncbi:hypothetical protein M0657_010701 [Pyricularia oryzae]|nr:hypothetical protein M0657_010701 [Pyricularia oryzae]
MDGVQISIRSRSLCSLIADYADFYGCLPPVLGLSGKIGLCQILIETDAQAAAGIKPTHCEVVLSYLILTIAKAFIVFAQTPTRRTSQLVALSYERRGESYDGKGFENNGAFMRD